MPRRQARRFRFPKCCTVKLYRTAGISVPLIRVGPPGCFIHVSITVDILFPLPYILPACSCHCIRYCNVVREIRAARSTRGGPSGPQRPASYSYTVLYSDFRVGRLGDASSWYSAFPCSFRVLRGCFGCLRAPPTLVSR
jgi:hypothetical protein